MHLKADGVDTDVAAHAVESKRTLAKLIDIIVAGNAFKVTSGIDTNAAAPEFESKRALAKLLETLLAGDAFKKQTNVR